MPKKSYKKHTRAWRLLVAKEYLAWRDQCRPVDNILLTKNIYRIVDEEYDIRTGQGLEIACRLFNYGAALRMLRLRRGRVDRGQTIDDSARRHYVNSVKKAYYKNTGLIRKGLINYGFFCYG